MSGSTDPGAMQVGEWDHMLVESPVSQASLPRTRPAGHEGQSQCTYCLSAGREDWYSVEDVMVVRHWKSTSQDVPLGGHWTWYCPEHFEIRGGRWWRHSHLAPARLLPKEEHFCARDVGLGTNCGEPAVERCEAGWFCETHAAAERVTERARMLFAEDVPDDPLA